MANENQLENPDYLNANLDNSQTQDIAKKQYAENVINAITNIGQGFNQTITNVSEELRQKQRAININAAELELENLPAYTEDFIKKKAVAEGKNFHDLTDEQIRGYGQQAEQDYIKSKKLDKTNYYNEALEVIGVKRPKINGALGALVRTEKQLVVEENVRDVARSKLAISRNPTELINNLATSLDNDTLAVGTRVMAHRNQMEGLAYNAIYKGDEKAMRAFVSPQAEEYFKDIKEYHPYVQQVQKQLKKVNAANNTLKFETFDSAVFNSYVARRDTDKPMTEADLLKATAEMRRLFPDKGRAIYNLEEEFKEKIKISSITKDFMAATEAGDYTFLARNNFKPDQVKAALDDSLELVIGRDVFSSATIKSLMNPVGKIDINSRAEVEAANEKQKQADDSLLQMSEFLIKQPTETRIPSIQIWADQPIEDMSKGVEMLNEYQFLNGATKGQITKYFKPERLSDMFYAAAISSANLNDNQKQEKWDEYIATRREYWNAKTEKYEHPLILEAMNNTSISFNEDVEEIARGNWLQLTSTDDLNPTSQEYARNFILSQASVYHFQNEDPDVALERAHTDFKTRHSFVENPDGSEDIIPEDFTKLKQGEKDEDVIRAFLVAQPEIKQEGALRGMGMGEFYKNFDRSSILERNVGFYPDRNYPKNKLMHGYVYANGVKQEVIKFNISKLRRWQYLNGKVDKSKKQK